MTARQKSLSARMPKLCAFYFPSDKTTGIAPVTNVLDGPLTEGEMVKCSWNDSEIDAIIVKLSDYRSALAEALDDFVPPTEESEDTDSIPRPEPRRQGRQGTTKTTNQKRSAHSIDSGESQRCLELPSDIPDYRIDETVQAVLQESCMNKRSAALQTDQTPVVNNSTQTDDDQCELLRQILEKVTSLEKQVTDMQQQLSLQASRTTDTSALVSSALHSLNDPYDFEASEVPLTATTPTTRTSTAETPTSRQFSSVAPATRLFSSPRCQPKTVMNELGFWKLLPSEVLNNDNLTITETARSKLPTDTPPSELSPSKLEELKASCLNQRPLFAKSLVHNYMTLSELYNRNVNGRNSTGHPKEKLNPVKIQYVREQTFKVFPCLPSETKAAWSECVKSIDKGNLYLFAQISKKFDLGPIMDYF